MTVIEAVKEAMNRPIRELSKLKVARPQSDWQIVFTMSFAGDVPELAVMDWQANHADCPYAKLPLEDLLAEDWSVEHG